MLDLNNLKEGDTYKINVLGTEYTIIFSIDNETYPWLDCSNGYEDTSTKEIVIKYKPEDADNSVQNYTNIVKKNIRHEVIHAFLDESGLAFDTAKALSWAINEEMVDWFAIQWPKISKVFIELGVI